MGKHNLKLGDLIDLGGLEKPAEGVLTMELGGTDGKPAAVEQLAVSMSDLAGRLEGNEDVSVRMLVGLVMATQNALKHELSPEITEKLLKTLQTRFENEENKRRRHPGMEWSKVQEKLEKNPGKLWSLNEMEKTGGEPDVTGYDPQTKEYIFIDCSAESPAGRRSCIYDKQAEEYSRKHYPYSQFHGNAVSKAALMGVNLLTGHEYLVLQTKGKFDRNTYSWLNTPVHTSFAGVALCGKCRDDCGDVYAVTAINHDVDRAFRASLRV